MSSRYCSKCGYPLVKNGKRKLKYRAEIQQYKCKRCGKYHSDNDFPQMKFPRKIVETASMLYHKGVPLRDVKFCICKISDVVIKSISVIWYWAQRFVGDSVNFAFSSLMLHMDDTQIKTNVKGKKFYLWAIKCPKTKALVTHVSGRRTEEEAEKLLRKAKRHFPVGYLPKAIRTDSFPGFYPAIMHVFGYRVKQDRFKSFESHSNNEIETIFRCKHRFPKFRILESARRFVDAWEKDHNSGKFADVCYSLFEFIMRFMK